MSKSNIKYFISLVLLNISLSVLWGAVGCSLNDPDRDVIRIFPASTNYKTEYISINSQGGEEMQREIEARLGDVFDEKFEKTDVEYSYYTILKGSEIIGRIHGLNQRGRFGGMQLILATDLEGRIVDFYYQKISSPEADKFKAIEFTNQFLGISLQDFYENAQDSTKTRLAQIKDPSQENRQDFEYTLRGIKKNLIQLDFFFLNRIHDKYFNPEKEN